jgi:hypothetical protein
MSFVRAGAEGLAVQSAEAIGGGPGVKRKVTFPLVLILATLRARERNLLGFGGLLAVDADGDGVAAKYYTYDYWGVVVDGCL